MKKVCASDDEKVKLTEFCICIGQALAQQITAVTSKWTLNKILRGYPIID